MPRLRTCASPMPARERREGGQRAPHALGGCDLGVCGRGADHHCAALARTPRSSASVRDRHQVARRRQIELEHRDQALTAGQEACHRVPRAARRRHQLAEPGRWKRSSCTAQLRPARGADRAPHTFGCRGHLDVLDAERREGVEHRVDDRGRHADRADLADALGAERVVRARRHVVPDLEEREVAARGMRVRPCTTR